MLITTIVLRQCTSQGSGKNIWASAEKAPLIQGKWLCNRLSKEIRQTGHRTRTRTNRAKLSSSKQACHWSVKFTIPAPCSIAKLYPVVISKRGQNEEWTLKSGGFFVLKWLRWTYRSLDWAALYPGRLICLQIAHSLVLCTSQPPAFYSRCYHHHHHFYSWSWKCC